jgi:hypothetical protein
MTYDNWKSTDPRDAEPDLTRLWVCSACGAENIYDDEWRCSCCHKLWESDIDGESWQ